MTPTNPTPKTGHGHAVPAGHGHHHDDHLYSPADLHNDDVDHEHSDVNIRAILGSAVGLFAVVGVCALIVLGLFKFFESQAAANDAVLSPYAVPAGQLPPGPRLLTDEPKNLKEFRDSLAERLKGVDEGKRQFLQHGVPVRADAPADPWMGTHSPARGESSGGRAIPIRAGDGGTSAAPAVTPAAPAATTPAAPVKGGGH